MTLIPMTVHRMWHRHRSDAAARPSVSLAGLFILLVLWTASPASGQVRKVSLEELARSSTSVVVGETMSTRSFWAEDGSQILTEVTVRVDQQIKGTASEEAIITIPGGQVGNTVYEVSDMPIFADGEEVVVFLWAHPSGKQLVTGASQGKLSVEADPATGAKVVSGTALQLRDLPPGETARASEQRLPLNELVDAVKQAGER